MTLYVCTVCSQLLGFGQFLLIKTESFEPQVLNTVYGLRVYASDKL